MRLQMHELLCFQGSSNPCHRHLAWRLCASLRRRTAAPAPAEATVVSSVSAVVVVATWLACQVPGPENFVLGNNTGGNASCRFLVDRLN